jgi:hypothetical protein
MSKSPNRAVIEVRKFLWLAIAVMLSTCVAADFSAEFSPSQRTIGQTDKAEYNVTIYHDFPGIEFFEIFSPEVLWDIRTKDALQIQPNKNFTTVLTIQPLNINPGLYGVPLQVKRTGTNEVKKAMLYMEVNGPPSTSTYLPAVRGTAEIPASVDPRNEIPITVNFENQNRRNLSVLKVKVRGNVINQDFITSLGPLERKTVKFMARVDPQTMPQKDTLTVSLIATEHDKGFQFDLPPVDYEVASYGQLVPSIELSKSFLKTVKVITLTNGANMVLEQPFAYPVSWFARIFTKSEPKARVENGSLVWDVLLNVGGSTQVRVTTNYLPLAILITLAAILIAVYYIFRSPLAIKKSAIVLSTREGGISELKILLELKNRTSKPIRGASIIDLVPRIAELIKEYDVGTLTPKDTLRSERKGTIIKYEVGDIMPREERVISYKVRSSLSILGGVSLPEAVSKFTTATGKERTTSSNKPKVKFLG